MVKTPSSYLLYWKTLGGLVTIRIHQLLLPSSLLHCNELWLRLSLFLRRQTSSLEGSQRRSKYAASREGNKEGDRRSRRDLLFADVPLLLVIRRLSFFFRYDFFLSSISSLLSALFHSLLLEELPSIQNLRHHLQGKKIVEIGSGRGGGAACLAKTFPSISEFIGIELASNAVKFSNEKFSSIQNLKVCLPGNSHLLIVSFPHTRTPQFIQGDAEDLRGVLPSSTVDLVLNIESQHCYSSLSSFASEVGRVLVPGGRFHFVGFISKEKEAWLESVFRDDGNLLLIRRRDITKEVCKSLELDESRKSALLKLLLPPRGLLFSFASGFIGAFVSFPSFSEFRPSSSHLSSL